MAEPKTKKAKRSTDACFSAFRRDTHTLNLLENVVDAFLRGLEALNIGVWHIEFANARLSECFSNASCRVNLFSDENGKKRVFKICDIFQPGITVLMKYLDESNPQIPEDEGCRSALEKLLKFISTDHQVLFDKGPDEKEGDWTVRLAEHLLSPLALSNGYIIDFSKDFPRSSSKCPCEKGDDLQGKIGDTTFGCELGWHGAADILMDDIAVRLTSQESEYMLSESGSTSSSSEINSYKNFTSDNINQMISQTIVYSFLQRKNNRRNLNNFLIPCVGISTKSLVGFFYDCEEDVLLLTEPLDLASGCERELNVCTVVFLWLTLNYKLFCSGITEEMRQYKADFFFEAGKLLNVYRNDVTRPMHTTRQEPDDYIKLRGWSRKMNQTKGFEQKDYGIKFIDLK